MTMPERIKNQLSRMGVGTSVKVLEEGPARFVILVASPSFEGMDEADRQAQLWDLLQEDLSDNEMRQIEYIFTESPSEQAA